MNENENKIQIPDESGQVLEFDLLFTFENDETGISYAVYTDESVDENGATRVYASRCASDDPTSELLPIESEEEWDMIEEVLLMLQEQARTQA